MTLTTVAPNEEQRAERVIWSSLPGSQTLALSCPANIILYSGSRGPGKTDTQLMRFRRNVGLGYGRFWRGVIFDREYKNLDDLVSKSQRWFPEFGDGARFLSSKSDYRWVWPTGEELLFRTMKKESDYWSYHGQEFAFIGWNELTKYPLDTLFEMMMSCNRTSFRPEDHPLTIDGDIYNATGQVVLIDEDEPNAQRYLLPEIPLEVFATCNPFGVGHVWCKKRFVTAAPAGQIVEKRVNVYNPQTGQREDVLITQVHIFGTYRENKYLSPKYIAELESISDLNKRLAWLGGSWDIVAGGMFDEYWDSKTHILRPFQIPGNWVITRSYDYGSSKPFSVGWWAISDGSDVAMPDGTWRSTVRGDVFRIAEWYGWSGKPNQGLNMLIVDVSKGIIEREMAMGIHGRVTPGPADSSIFDVENGNSLAADFTKPVRIGTKVHKGIEWKRSDKSPGSRKAGWEKCKKYLQQAKRKTVEVKGVKMAQPRELPGMFIFDCCKMFIDLFPTLPRDEQDMDDVDTESEDHIGDEVRYFILSQGLGARGGKTKGT